MINTWQEFNIFLCVLFIILFFIVNWWVDLVIVTILYFALRKRFGYVPKSKKKR